MVMASAVAAAMAKVVTQCTCVRDGAALATRVLTRPGHADLTIVFVSRVGPFNPTKHMGRDWRSGEFTTTRDDKVGWVA